jgi:hypothetical protein
VIQTFPRVDTGLATDDEKSVVKALLTEYGLTRDLKVKAAIALVRKGTKPYRKPPAAVIAKRRAKGKAQRQARKRHR